MSTLKVRIGVALGGYADAGRYPAAVDRLEELGVDSLWVQEMVFGPLVEPFIGMAHALSRTSRLKVGTGVAILPGRHPVLVAKQLASLAALAPGRVLPAFGLQPARPEERPDSAQPVRSPWLRRRSGFHPEPTFRRGCHLLGFDHLSASADQEAQRGQLAGREALSSPGLVATKARPQMTEVSVARTAS